jgi:hypothetical protein
MTKGITKENNSIDYRIPKTPFSKIEEHAAARNLKYTVELKILSIV